MRVRRTRKRIFDRLVDEHDVTGGRLVRVGRSVTFPWNDADGVAAVQVAGYLARSARR
ncbi:hypothetical protein B0I32_103625 [Nonomuraea fuscirosea]|uniref:Uncharacterized protein n=1 Tax=Nonomuraea fuscirosea TaxID=1291556 RepID=A0A2T0N7Y0_9ACTN|nr:hypothetical protein [Nonomuraea fuscirosea]PRX68663.1 hypothetical protein B0I32_103625 [Nonomuraea fuscirosea]